MTNRSSSSGLLTLFVIVHLSFVISHLLIPAMGGSLPGEEGTLSRLQTENFAHGGVASPVDRQGSQFFEEPAMLRCRIPFVRRKAVTGVDPIVLLHQSVSGGL